MWVNVLLKAALFVALVPGVLLRVPEGSSKEVQALVHGVVFAIVNWYVYMYVLPMIEGFDMPDSRKNPPCPEGSVRCSSGDCRVKGDIYSPCPE
jgi:hypothetical protein